MIESVPNLSEGRDLDVIERVARAVRSSGAHLLDVHSDADHHRSVLTFSGDPDVVIAGVLSMVDAAVAAVDIGSHRGEHPRIGAVDVIPFVPLEGSSMEECVSVARTVGRQIGERWCIPVYLYEAASSRPDRRNLADVRRGGSDALAERIESEAGRPDFGPPRLHPTAGAVAVGARGFLVAYNVNLASDDLDAARSIARAVRGSNSGLRGVKALGVMLHSRGLAQVTMNLTDIGVTTVLDAFESVRAEAEQRGLRILESEIVGLVPRRALAGAGTGDLLLTRPVEEVVFEDRVAGS